MPQPRDMTDEELCRQFQETNGTPGNPIADALLREIQRRDLDI